MVLFLDSFYEVVPSSDPVESYVRPSDHPSDSLSFDLGFDHIFDCSDPASVFPQLNHSSRDTSPRWPFEDSYREGSSDAITIPFAFSGAMSYDMSITDCVSKGAFMDVYEAEIANSVGSPISNPDILSNVTSPVEELFEETKQLPDNSVELNDLEEPCSLPDAVISAFSESETPISPDAPGNSVTHDPTPANEPPSPPEISSGIATPSPEQHQTEHPISVPKEQEADKGMGGFKFRTVRKPKIGSTIYYQLIRRGQIIDGICSGKTKQIINSFHVEDDQIWFKIKFHKMSVFRHLSEELGFDSSDLKDFLESNGIVVTTDALKNIQWGPYELRVTIEEDVYISNPFLITSTGRQISRMKIQPSKPNPLEADPKKVTKSSRRPNAAHPPKKMRR
eukprot:TRINITY_DN8003_c0_g1_i1.p1 TRINITY_DN8003_c0_g1~~TRINITY_DN8003_c0_g1_i1.p1  ORF type:complete len:393 (-),score=64.54 TRINITY_DN8003_c0_g1_i1:25-1203(-)